MYKQLFMRRIVFQQTILNYSIWVDLVFLFFSEQSILSQSDEKDQTKKYKNKFHTHFTVYSQILFDVF